MELAEEYNKSAREVWGDNTQRRMEKSEENKSIIMDFDSRSQRKMVSRKLGEKFEETIRKRA